jgi:hypothetical protein
MNFEDLFEHCNDDPIKLYELAKDQAIKILFDNSLKCANKIAVLAYLLF